MITKNDIEIALNKYDSERSLWKVGFFGAAVDYVTTPFYYCLKNFYNNKLNNYPENTALSPGYLAHLSNILEKADVGPNSTNGAIIHLYDDINDLVNRNPNPRATAS